jgi:Calcineurin-like phosphoesterase
MKTPHAVLVAAVAAAFFVACGTGGENVSSGQSSAGTGGAAVACPPCQMDSDCAKGAPASKCGQFAGDTYCAPDCSAGQACPADRACTAVADSNGAALKVCIPTTNVCGPAMQSTSSSSSSASASSASASSASASSGAGGGPSAIEPTGGTIPTLDFAIVGDTRPPNEGDAAGYPTAVITKIWQDVEAHSPRPAFAVTTGDYMFASSTSQQSVPQLGLYLTARQSFLNVVFPAMGNHECTGATASNCGQGNANGITVNYTNFLALMLQPLGQSLPYYTIDINGVNDAWTAKFVFIACNAWDATQSAWLTAELAKPTTYTFAVRHEGSDATTAPCVKPSGTILRANPLTLLIAGHTHTFTYYPGQKQVIVGNGGAPLTGSVNYGYVIGEQQPNGMIQFKEYDYATNVAQMTFDVSP